VGKAAKRLKKKKEKRESGQYRACEWPWKEQVSRRKESWSQHQVKMQSLGFRKQTGPRWQTLRVGRGSPLWGGLDSEHSSLAPALKRKRIPVYIAPSTIFREIWNRLYKLKNEFLPQFWVLPRNWVFWPGFWYKDNCVKFLGTSSHNLTHYFG
jgi:hypothetical protein